MTQSRKAEVAAEASTFRIDPATVVGWGVDADPANDPTWPMRLRQADEGSDPQWEPPEAQQTDVEILQSVEHRRRPAVVGTSTPPSGLSGGIRRYAFGFSESQWGHWLLLMLADRVNTVEGLIDDFGRGRLPNVLVERGVVGRRDARQAAAASVLILVGLGALVVLTRRGRSRRGGLF